MAARGLISLFRTVNPKLLARKDRGRPTEAIDEGIIAGPLQFGAAKTVDFVPGAEILPENADEAEESENDQEEESDSDSEWETIAHSDDEVEKEGEAQDEAEDDDDAEDEDDLAEDEDGWVTDSGDEMVEDDDEEVDSEEENESEEEEEIEEKVKSKKEVKEKPIKVKKLNRDQHKAQRRKERAGNEIAKVEKAKLVSETRILSDADFRKIRVHQLKKQVGATDNRKRTNADIRLEEEFEEKRSR